MEKVLRHLDHEGAMSGRQLYSHIYDPIVHGNRRIFAASISRTIRRLELRGLIKRTDVGVDITQSGRWALHPEEKKSFSEGIAQAVQRAVAQGAAESPEYQRLLQWSAEVEASWARLRKSKG